MVMTSTSSSTRQTSSCSSSGIPSLTSIWSLRSRTVSPGSTNISRIGAAFLVLMRTMKLPRVCSIAASWFAASTCSQLCMPLIATPVLCVDTCLLYTSPSPRDS
eukprot:TRINITY_DN807_c0_g1_i3.p2 TRINITY_DN807_c0_g1~~TRINITY_DN807_c0_g1_i3.p2  ORF type:complete len:104 (-),score=18.37 TRINITY_DN807_c0_g1_i3:114-425(-)